MATLKDLAKRIKKLKQELPERVNEYTKETAIDLVRNLAYSTPVDTSQALSNWQAGTDIWATFRPAFVEGFGGSSQEPSAEATIQDAKNELDDREYGESIYVYNNTPYIQDLEDGTSLQARNGFIRPSLIRTRINMKKRRSNLLEDL